eukprot:g15620.t1
MHHAAPYNIMAGILNDDLNEWAGQLSEEALDIMKEYHRVPPRADAFPDMLVPSWSALKNYRSGRPPPLPVVCRHFFAVLVRFLGCKLKGVLHDHRFDGNSIHARWRQSLDDNDEPWTVSRVLNEAGHGDGWNGCDYVGDENFWGPTFDDDDGEDGMHPSKHAAKAATARSATGERRVFAGMMAKNKQNVSEILRTVPHAKAMEIQADDRIGKRRPSTSLSKTDGNQLSDEAQAEASARAKEAPIRGLAMQLSRKSMFSTDTKSSSMPSGHGRSASNMPPGHQRESHSMPSHVDGGGGGGGHHKKNSSSILGSMFPPSQPRLSFSTSSRAERHASGAQPVGPSAPIFTATSAADVVSAQTASAVGGPRLSPQSQPATTTATLGLDHLSKSNQHRRDASRSLSTNPQQLEEGSGRRTWPHGPLHPPETPPILVTEGRRSSLVGVNKNMNRDSKETEAKSEPELMIGEIRSIQIADEIALARKALVIIVVSLVGATLIRRFAGPLSEDLNIIEIVGFVSTLLLSFPVIRFTVRLFAYVVTTRASGLLYKGNSFYFAVALHQDISMTIWCIVAVSVWIQLFPDWVYSDERERLARNVYRYGGNVLKCFLAWRVGVLVKNFLVLLVATSYLWRPYLQRVQSSILAQYILLLLTDYATKGFYNPDDERFAVEMGRQGIKEEKNISLYAVSKAMGFIPRNKLGHAFFRELNESDTLNCSKDARTLGMFLFDQIVYRSRPKPDPDHTAPPSPAPATGRLNAVLAKVGGGVGYSVTNALSTRSTRGPRGGGAGALAANRRPGLPAAFLEPSRSRSVSPRHRPGSESGSGSVSSGSRHGLTPHPGGDGGGGGGGGGGKVPVMDRLSRKVTVGLGKMRSGTGSSSSGTSGSSSSGSVVVGVGGGRSGSSGTAATEANSSTGTIGSLAPGFADGRGLEGDDGGPVDFRRLGAGGGWAGGLSVIEDNESQAGSTLASVRARGEESASYFGAEESKSEQPQTEGHRGHLSESEGGVLAGASPTNDASDEFDKRLARVTAGSARSFSTAEGDDNDNGDGGRGGRGEGDTDDASAAGRQDENDAAVRQPGAGGGQTARGRKRHKGKEEGGEEEEEEEEEGEGDEVLTRQTLCPGLDKLLLDVAFKIFDGNENSSITKEEMVLGVVETFRDHRSLANTLRDSEHIARKLGLIIMWLINVVLFFVWLSIWGADVLSLSLTFSSFLIAFSFMIGTAASNLVTAVLFIFVSRLYDVGDRVHIYDGSETVGVQRMDVTVSKIDLRTTSFRRWDEQIFYIPNHLLATKTIVNIQRTADQWHEFRIQVAANTPSEKLKKLEEALKAFAESKDKAEGLYPRTGFALLGIEDSTKLSIRITFRQRANWQNMDKKWACQSMCTWAIKNACDSIGITYSLPEVPLRMKNKLL